MKTIKLSSLLLYFVFLSFISMPFGVNAQNQSLKFDGSAYVNLGNQVGNGVRTIEMWFNLDDDIGPSLQQFSVLLHRNTELCGNCNEIGLTFDPYHQGSNAGKIRFKLNTPTGTKYEVVSNSNNWQKNRWYHVAAVIDAQSGISLFIDGIKQNNTNPFYTSPTPNANQITGLGCQGNRFDRRFEGLIEEVRISSVARYHQNFTPQCILNTDAATIAHYKMNAQSNGKLPDNSINAHTGFITNTSLSGNNSCLAYNAPMSLVEENSDEKQLFLTAFPNPFIDQIQLRISRMDIETNYRVRVLSITGKVIRNIRLKTKQSSLDLSEFESGLYFIELMEGQSRVEMLKIIKQ